MQRLRAALAGARRHRLLSLVAAVALLVAGLVAERTAPEPASVQAGSTSQSPPTVLWYWGESQFGFISISGVQPLAAQGSTQTWFYSPFFVATVCCLLLQSDSVQFSATNLPSGCTAEGGRLLCRTVLSSSFTFNVTVPSSPGVHTVYGSVDVPDGQVQTNLFLVVVAPAATPTPRPSCSPGHTAIRQGVGAAPPC